MTANSEPLTANEANTARRRGLTLIAAAVALVAIGWGGWHWANGRHVETTDNAYVAGNVVQITPQIGGTVVSIGADDTDYVKAGQLLVKLDPADARVALEQAEAQLAQTVREVRTLYANNSTLKAQVSLRSADLARAQAEALTEALLPWREKYPDVEVTEESRLGSPAGHLIDLARDSSLVVVGRRIRRSPFGMHIGAVAHAVMHHATAPVAVVAHD